MRLSADYLKEALEKMGDISQNKKAEKLGLSGPAMSQYMTGARTMDDFACIMVAKVLGIDGMIVIAAAQMEREKNQARKDVWEDLLKKMGALVLAWMAAGAMLAGSLSHDSASANSMLTSQYVAMKQHDKCILCQIMNIPQFRSILLNWVSVQGCFYNSWQDCALFYHLTAGL